MSPPTAPDSRSAVGVEWVPVRDVHVMTNGQVISFPSPGGGQRSGERRVACHTLLSKEVL